MFFQGIWPRVGLMGHCCCSVTKSCLTLSDSMDSSTPYSPVLQYHPEFAQTHVHRVSDAIRTSHLLLSSSPPILNLSQHRVFSKESTLHFCWPKYWTFCFSISPSNEYSGLISLGLTDSISLQSKGLSRVFNTTVQKHQFFSIQHSLWCKSHIHT